MKRTGIICMLFFIIAAVSGCIFSSDDDKEIKKGTIKGKVSMIVTGEPAAGVKVMLINRDAKIDTTNRGNYENNRTAFVDSAFTNAQGEYVIESIPPGVYAVAPVNCFTDTTAASYKFTPDRNSGSYEFAVNGDSHTVSFIAEKLEIPGAEEDGFRVITLIKKIAGYQVAKVFMWRKFWVAFIPMYVYVDECTLHHSYDSDTSYYYCGVSCDYGYTAVIGTLDNALKYSVIFTRDNDPREYTADFYIDFTVFNTPRESTWEFDLITRTATRVE
jgi:hypothetical protein